MTALVGALIVSAIGGAGVFALVRPRRALDAFEAAGMSLFWGSVLTSALLFGMSGILTGPALVGTVSAVLIVAGVAAVPVLGRASWVTVPGAKPFLWLLLAGLGFVAWQAWAQPLGGDGVFNFECRARFAWEHGGRIPAEFFSDPSRAWLHQGYPLFLSMNELWVYLWLGEPNQVLVKVLGVLWFGALAGVIFSQLARLTGESRRGWLALALLLFVPAVVTSRGGAASLWADFPFGSLAVIAALYLVEFRRHGTGQESFAAALAALPWVKREGVILGAVLLASFAWCAVREGRWKVLLVAGAPFAAVATVWALIAHRLHVPPVGDFATPGPALLLANLGRLPRIVAIALREFAVLFRWSLLWLLAALAWWRIGRDAGLSAWRPLVAANVGAIAVYASLYFFSTWPMLAWHMATSYPRLLLPPAMIAIVLVAAAVPLPSPQASSD